MTLNVCVDCKKWKLENIDDDNYCTNHSPFGQCGPDATFALLSLRSSAVGFGARVLVKMVSRAALIAIYTFIAYL